MSKTLFEIAQAKQNKNNIIDIKEVLWHVNYFLNFCDDFLGYGNNYLFFIAKFPDQQHRQEQKKSSQ